MGVRRESRESALQALHAMDMQHNMSERMLSLFCESFPPTETGKDFFDRLVKGVMQVQSELDDLIERFSSNWKLSRMSGVDRNILRIAAYEILYCDDIPYKVSINEAIDIGKKFGTEESGAFINGILDSIRIALENKEINVSEVASP